MQNLPIQHLYTRIRLSLCLAALLGVGTMPSALAAPGNDSATAPEPVGIANNAGPADESPMMLYLVPWNANPEKGKSGKKFTLYQPWGSHFDPLTPVQIQQLNAQ
ncbi:MAG: hypothetical protein U1F46_00270 [Marinagarivorans sp.]